MSGAIHVESEVFQQVVGDSELPVLVDFWAPWCRPCSLISPMIDEIADEYEGKARVTKINIDTSPDLAHFYGIRGIPTLLIMKKGIVVDRIVGAPKRAVITSKLDQAMVME